MEEQTPIENTPQASKAPEGSPQETPTALRAKLLAGALLAVVMPRPGWFAGWQIGGWRDARGTLRRYALDERPREVGRVGRAHCCARPPSEPDVHISMHPAQASPWGWLAGRSAGLLLLRAYCRWQ